MTSDLHYLELTELSRRIHARELSSLDATKAQLGRIEKLDGQLKSYGAPVKPARSRRCKSTTVKE
jgi:amidase